MQEIPQVRHGSDTVMAQISSEGHCRSTGSAQEHQQQFLKPREWPEFCRLETLMWILPSPRGRICSPALGQGGPSGPAVPVLGTRQVLGQTHTREGKLLCALSFPQVIFAFSHWRSSWCPSRALRVISVNVSGICERG